MQPTSPGWCADRLVRRSRAVIIRPSPPSNLPPSRGVYPTRLRICTPRPTLRITRAEAAVALAAHFGEKLDREKRSRGYAIDRGWMATDHRNWFHPDLPLLWTDIREEISYPKPLPAIASPNLGPVRRSEFVSRLFKQ